MQRFGTSISGLGEFTISTCVAPRSFNFSLFHYYYPLQTSLTFSSPRHMGETAVNAERGDVEKIITALRETLAEARAQK